MRKNKVNHRKFKHLIKWKVYIKNIFNLKNFFILTFLMILMTILGPFTIYKNISNEYSDQIYTSIEEVPNTRVAIVFGAGLTGDGSKPSDILKDRIETSVDLYKEGKVQKIIMSGDNRYDTHNEPQVMIDYAMQLGVSELDLQADYAGRRTYDSCYRAREIFGVNEAILISQEYHLPRALYICNSLGIESIGVSADKSLYQNIDTYEKREILATVLAFWEVNIDAPEVLLGERIDL